VSSVAICGRAGVGGGVRGGGDVFLSIRFSVCNNAWFTDAWSTDAWNPVVGATCRTSSVSLVSWGNGGAGEERVGHLTGRASGHLDFRDPKALRVLTSGTDDVANGFQFPDCRAHRIAAFSRAGHATSAFDQLIYRNQVVSRIRQQLCQKSARAPRQAIVTQDGVGDLGELNSRAAPTNNVHRAPPVACAG